MRLPLKRLGPLRLTVLAFGTFLTLRGLQGAATDAWQGLHHDYAHDALHLASGLAALATFRRTETARTFALAFGGAYLALGLAGWLTPLGPLHLDWAANTFHMAAGSASLGVGVWVDRAS
jgi:hypothetical protein